MFSANENLQLRQHKRRIVEYVEACVPEDLLDLGVTVMVMQVSCKSPGCVPIETAIVIVFPKATSELLPGLPESQGGSYKTKVLKPMSAVTKEDVLESLPPVFPGGLRSVEKLCLQARDVMLAQITQLFGEEDLEGRRLMAEYLQTSLRDYMQRGCTPPEWGEAFAPLLDDDDTAAQKTAKSTDKSSLESMDGTKNVVIRRIVDAEEEPSPRIGHTKTTVKTLDASLSSAATASVESVTRRRQQQAAERELNQLESFASGGTGNNPLSRLAQREHAPGMRQPGCPCCDPDNPANVVDQLLQF